MMPHLAATFNFGSYLKNLNKMGHYIGATLKYTSFTKSIESALTYYPITEKAVIAQCNVTLDLKYNSAGSICAAITSCDKTALNARFCKDEAKAIVCKDNYHWGNLNI